MIVKWKKKALLNFCWMKIPLHKFQGDVFLLAVDQKNVNDKVRIKNENEKMAVYGKLR